MWKLFANAGGNDLAHVPNACSLLGSNNALFFVVEGELGSMGAAIQAAVYGFILTAGNWNAVFISIAVFCALIAAVSFVSSRK
jgi:hypothetical protein